MKIKLLSTAIALTLATTMVPVFGQSGGGNSDGGGRQGVGAVSTAEKNAPPALVADSGYTSSERMTRRSREYPQVVDRTSPEFSGIEENHLLNVEHK